MAEGKTPYPARIVTPDGEIYNDDVELLIVTGVGGKTGFYARHAPLVADLKMGDTRATLPDGTTRVWATMEGFAMVHDSTASIVVEDAILVDDIDVGEVQIWLDEALGRKSKLEAGSDDALYQSDLASLDKTISWGEYLLSVAGEHSGAVAAAH